MECYGTDAQWEAGLGSISHEVHTDETFKLSEKVFYSRNGFKDDFYNLRGNVFDSGTRSKKAAYYGISGSLDEISIDTSEKLYGSWPTSGDFENPYYGKTRQECKATILKYLRTLKNSQYAEDTEKLKLDTIIMLLKKSK